MSEKLNLENTAIETVKISLTQTRDYIFGQLVNFKLCFRSVTTETLIFFGL